MKVCDLPLLYSQINSPNYISYKYHWIVTCRALHLIFPMYLVSDMTPANVAPNQYFGNSLMRIKRYVDIDLFLHVFRQNIKGKWMLYGFFVVVMYWFCELWIIIMGFVWWWVCCSHKFTSRTRALLCVYTQIFPHLLCYC